MLEINEKRFLKNLAAQGEIGWIKNEGLFREGFSENFGKARSFVKARMEEGGLATRVDPLGNLFGRVEGRQSEKILLSGSHLDSVTGGGKLDGAYGVIAALEVALVLKENGSPLKHSFEAVGFNSEEGSDLGGSFGSRAFCGLVEKAPNDEILQRYDLTPTDIANSKGDLARYAAFLEAHIEQGIVLHNRGITIGVPSAIAGITRFRCVVTGRSNHAGTTPMLDRKDALYETMLCLSQWMTEMRKEPTMVCNVGCMNVEPGHICVVPAKTEFVVEIRAIDDTDVQRAAASLKECMGRLPSCKAELTLSIAKPAAVLNEAVGEAVYRTSMALGNSTLKMVSGASHDASPLSHVMPTGMIFVPSVDGISHAKEETTGEADLLAGTRLLLQTLLELDEQLP